MRGEERRGENERGAIHAVNEGGEGKDKGMPS